MNGAAHHDIDVLWSVLGLANAMAGLATLTALAGAQAYHSIYALPTDGRRLLMAHHGASFTLLLLLPSASSTGTLCATTPARTENYTAPHPAGYAYHTETYEVAQAGHKLPISPAHSAECLRWPYNNYPLSEMSGWTPMRSGPRGRQIHVRAMPTHVGPLGAEAFLGHGRGENAVLPVVPQRGGGCLEYHARYGDSDRGTGTVHKTLALLARLTRPGDIVLEIGTFMGISTFHIAHNLPEGAKVVTMDGAGLIRDPVYSSKSGSIINYPSYIPGHVFINATRAVSGRIIQLIGDSTTFNPVPFKGRATFAWVDGGHSLSVCLSDSLHALAVVRDGGWILWDDVGSWLWREVKPCLDSFLAHPEVRPLMRLPGAHFSITGPFARFRKPCSSESHSRGGRGPAVP